MFSMLAPVLNAIFIYAWLFNFNTDIFEDLDVVLWVLLYMILVLLVKIFGIFSKYKFIYDIAMR